MQSLVIDPEVVADLVDHGATHLLDDLVPLRRMAQIACRKIVIRSRITAE
ncbi:MAG: hypothetical protein QOE71_2728 [Pseudonocardiales bacterium]|nr:hypothetical protein [Pseudonocardiales bacterium]